MRIPKLVLTDIDGVWTDGGMYYSEDRNELKKFNTSDSVGVIFLRLLNIPTGIITGENTSIVKWRAQKLKIEIVETGISNKLKVVQQIANDLNIDLNEIAYIGDDIGDICLLKSVGISAVPKNAPNYVAKYAQYKLKKSGGEGVFREFVEMILNECDLLEEALAKYLKSL